MTKKLTTTIPPLRGPNPQGLNVPTKKIIVVSNSEKNKMSTIDKSLPNVEQEIKLPSEEEIAEASQEESIE